MFTLGFKIRMWVVDGALCLARLNYDQSFHRLSVNECYVAQFQLTEIIE